LPFNLIADLELPDDDFDTVSTITEVHVNHQNYLRNQASSYSESIGHARSAYSVASTQTDALTYTETSVQGGASLDSPLFNESASTPAEQPSPVLEKALPTKTDTAKEPTIKDTKSKPAPSPIEVPSKLTNTPDIRGVTKTDSKPPVNQEASSEKSTKTLISPHELPNLARDVTLSLTVAHALRGKSLHKSVTLEQFYDCTFDTLNRSSSDSQDRLKTYPDALRSLSRNFIRNADKQAIETWSKRRQTSHPGHSAYDLINHPLFSSQPTEIELKYRLDNCLIKYALTTTFTGKIERQFIPPFHSSIKSHLSTFKSERLFEWMQKVRKDSPAAYDNDKNFFSSKSSASSTKPDPKSLASMKHSCPPLSESMRNFASTSLPQIVNENEAEITKFQLPKVPGYTDTQLAADLIYEVICHFPQWVRPVFVASPAQVLSVTQFLSLNLNDLERTNILWMINTLLRAMRPKVPV